jgi:membrane-bound serine protease (ClpP class)
VIGVSGIILIGLSLVFSMQDFAIPRFDWEWELLGRNALVVFTSLIGATLGIAILALFGPKIILFDRLMLKAQITGTSGGIDPDFAEGKALAADSSYSYEDDENYSVLVGKHGTADSVLRPSGRAMIDGKSYSVDADNEFVDAGSEIVVTRVRGNRITVKKV